MNSDAYMLLIVLVSFVVGAIYLSPSEVSIWKENFKRQSLRSIIWFSLATILFGAILALLVAPV
jgi:ABC-type Fe3+ transport system permease subunit